MSVDISVKFPAQELQKSLDNIQGLLDAAKPLAEELVLDEKVKEAIAKCIEALQALLSQEDKNWQQPVEHEAMEVVRLRKKKRNGTITWEELERLKQLESKSY